MDNKIIGRFIPVGKYNNGAKPFFVLTKEPSDYLAPAWKGIMSDGKEYHVIESAWEFEPIEWDGEGLPPVGAEVECICNEFQNDGQEKLLGHILYSGEYTILKTYKTNHQHHFPVESVFKTKLWAITPIRSEADKKRDEAIKQICEVLSVGKNTEDDAKNIYEYIKSGKIIID